MTRSQTALIDMTGIMPAGSMGQITLALVRSGQFRVVFSNSSAIILQYTPSQGGAAP